MLTVANKLTTLSVFMLSVVVPGVVTLNVVAPFETLILKNFILSKFRMG